MVIDELDKYNDLKDKTHTKQSGLSQQEKKKLIEQGKAQALSAIQKKIKDTYNVVQQVCVRQRATASVSRNAKLI